MENTARGFRQLGVWRKGYEMTLDVYRLTKGFPKSEIYGLTAQLQRAAVSVPANIAEGYDRNHKKEYLQFLFIARGSLGELETLLMLAKKNSGICPRRITVLLTPNELKPQECCRDSSSHCPDPGPWLLAPGPY